MKKVKKVKKVKKLSTLKTKTWNIFSKYIRLKDSKHGMVVCYTCEKTIPWKEAQCGHWVEGRHNAVLMNENFVKCQCVKCNIFLHGNQGEFRDKIRKELGDKRVDELLVYSHTISKITRDDYEVVYKHYKRLLDELVW